MCICRAKKSADIAKAVADDLIMQAMEEDDDEDKEPENDIDDIIDVAAAIAGPTVEDVSPVCKAWPYYASPEVLVICYPTLVLSA